LIAAVIFDVGNTLLHLDYAWIAGHFGRPPGEVRAAEIDVRRALSGHGGNYFVDVARRLGLPPEAGLAVLVEHDRRPEGLWCMPDPDAVPVLRELARRGVRLGVVSNADGRVRAQLERAGLAPFFDVIVDSAEVGVSKPDPAIFRLAAARMGVAPGDAIYVGDIYQVDVAGARAAGMRALWLAPGADGRAYPERIERLSDILTAISDLGGA
jgi:HAD superfamily hydrolase (TIGR01509 family)